MAALARIPLLCALVGLCTVVCHSSDHNHNHNGHRHHRHELAAAVEESASSVWDDAEDASAAVGVSSSCCARRSKVVQVGHGMFGYGVQLDVGQCQKTYRERNFIDTESEHVDDYILQEECPPDYSCLPSASTLRRVFVRGGMHEVSVVDECRCKDAAAACRRTDHSVLLYPGTPFEARLDVGMCAGNCDQGGCRPVRNRTMSVASPSGSSCHSVIEECGCAPSCYRVSAEETVYDYSNANRTDDDEPEIKRIDLGRCVGSCSLEQSAVHKCLLRDSSNPGRCLAGLYNMHAACSPVAFRVHSYVAKDKQTKEVVAITACKCV